MELKKIHKTCQMDGRVTINNTEKKCGDLPELHIKLDHKATYKQYKHLFSSGIYQENRQGLLVIVL